MNNDDNDSPSSPKSTKPTRVSINQRRAFLVRNLRSRGAVSMAVLSQYLEHESTTSAAALDNDIEFLNSLGFSVSFVESDGRRYLVDSTARHLGAKSERTDLYREEKQAIAATAVALILGLPDRQPTKFDEIQRRKRLETTNPELGYLHTSGELMRLLRQNTSTEADPHEAKVRAQLGRLWMESNISVFCDAGTTNDRMGNVLRDLFLPTSFSQLRNLQICTNGRVLFNAMADPEVCAKGIVTGGYQLGVDGSTDSIAGSYTEAWLRSTEGILNFGICFIGCTAIDAQQGFLLSDSFEEKTVKEIVMSPLRSRIRVINVDRSKFSMAPMREGFRFATISPDQVDLIITNTASSAEDPAIGLIQRIRQMGVPVIEVPLPAKDSVKQFNAISRGSDLRVRLGFDKLDRLLHKLGMNVAVSSSSRALDSETESDGSAKPLLLPTKYVSRSVELFLDAATDFLLDDNSRDGEKARSQIIKRFQDLREETFLAPRDPIRDKA